MNQITIVGTGDHARVIADLARALGLSIAGFIELEAVAGAHAGVSPLLGDLQTELGWLERLDDAHFVVAIGSSAIRRGAFERCVKLGLQPATLVHPTAVLLGGAQVGVGTQVCAQALLGVDTYIGRNVIVNTAATLDHDVHVEDHALIGPGARLAGRVAVGKATHIGLAAAVREGTIIGDGALVAAGAVVIDDVPPGGRVAGVPARPMHPAAGR